VERLKKILLTLLLC